MIQRICVFCGSSDGAKPEYLDAATELGKQLAATNIGLVYGGAGVGLMGAVADAVLAAGGEVIGVMPRSLVEREVAHRKLRDLRVVGSMHERKALMAELADAFIALPGGLLRGVDLGATGRACQAPGLAQRSRILRPPARVFRPPGQGTLHPS